MRIFGTLMRRELAAFFFSITGYVIIAAVTLLVGLSFVVLIAGLGNDPFTAQVTEMFYGTFYFWLILLLVTPVITMRLFALEKSSGTFETLMTTPVGDLQVVAAKFAAAIVFYMMAWLPMLACLFIVRHFTNQSGALDAGTVGGMYLGIFLTGCLFLSLGCFASAISQSQMAAAMISLVLGVSLFSLGFLAKSIPVTAQWQSQALSYFSLFDQMNDFARGVVDTRTVIFYVSATFFFLFLTLRVVESRRWK
jgi:gliding motility-associated transport system permease protein